MITYFLVKYSALPANPASTMHKFVKEALWVLDGVLLQLHFVLLDQNSFLDRNMFLEGINLLTVTNTSQVIKIIEIQTHQIFV